MFSKRELGTLMRVNVSSCSFKWRVCVRGSEDFQVDFSHKSFCWWFVILEVLVLSEREWSGVFSHKFLFLTFVAWGIETLSKHFKVNMLSVTESFQSINHADFTCITWYIILWWKTIEVVLQLNGQSNVFAGLFTYKSHSANYFPKHALVLRFL